MIPDAEQLIAQIRSTRMIRPVGRVAAVEGGTIEVSGLSEQAHIGSQIVLRRRVGRPIGGEVIRVDPESVYVLPGAAPEGVSVGDRVILRQVPLLAPSPHWIGRVIDPLGRPLDGMPLPRGREARDVNAAPPEAASRRGMGARLQTGLSVFNTLLPIAQGQRVGLFAGSGIGKSRLLAKLVQTMDTDVAVIALIGERGREVGEFVRSTLGPKGMKRAVVIAATSDQSALVRRRCAWSAMTVGLVMPVAIFFLFDQVFEIRFPRGLLTNLWYG